MTAPPLWLWLITLWWLCLCAVHDWRTRTVSNWLTLPPFLAALPIAHWLSGLNGVGFTLLVFLCCYRIWQTGGMGAADGKVAVVLAAVMPASLPFGVAALWLMLGAERLMGRHSHAAEGPRSVPGVTGMFLGLATLCIWMGMRT